MVDTIICIGANMFRIYLVYRFMQAFFDKANVSGRLEFLAYGIYFIINTALYLKYHLAWVNVLNSWLGILFVSFLYTKLIKKVLFVATSVYLINMGCDIVATVPFANYRDGYEVSQICFVLTDLFILICELVVERLISIKKEESNNLPLILVPLCSAGIIFFMTYTGRPLEIEIIIVSAGLLLLNFLVLYLYNLLLESVSQQYENIILNQKVQMYSHQMNILMQNEDRVASLRHDMKHHLNELKLLAMKKDDEGIQSYIDSMEEFIQNPNEIVSSGNTDVDSLLNYMLARARNELNKVDVKIELTEDISASFDINVILGNLLENAIEASADTEEKILNVSIQLKRGVLRIEIANSFNGNLARGKQGLMTTKTDKENHGIGLKSVRRIIEKYDGIMEVSEEGLFCVKIVLYMPIMEE